MFAWTKVARATDTVSVALREQRTENPCVGGSIPPLPTFLVSSRFNLWCRCMIRIGTRGSKLARWQADWVAGQLSGLGHDVEIVVIKTSGDTVQAESIAYIGAQGVFTREIQQALLRGEIDVAVHSLKDLPTEPVEGLVLGAVPKRGPHQDVFCSVAGNSSQRLEDLPKNSRIGTGSLRRKTQIIHRFGDRFRIDDIRGNVETRLRKLDEGEYDALILAEAGLERLDFADRVASLLEPPDFLPAVGQGALGLEIRDHDETAAKTVAPLTDPATFAAVLAERAFLHTLQGGCIAPIAALAQVRDNTLTLQGRVLSLDGTKMLEAEESIPYGSADLGSEYDAGVQLGIILARKLLAAGAGMIMNEIRCLRQR